MIIISKFAIPEIATPQRVKDDFKNNGVFDGFDVSNLEFTQEGAVWTLDRKLVRGGNVYMATISKTNNISKEWLLAVTKHPMGSPNKKEVVDSVFHEHNQGRLPLALRIKAVAWFLEYANSKDLSKASVYEIEDELELDDTTTETAPTFTFRSILFNALLIAVVLWAFVIFAMVYPVVALTVVALLALSIFVGIELRVGIHKLNRVVSS